MQKFKYHKRLCLKTIFALLFVTAIVGCAQVEQIPKQVPEELPNPVSDFTQKDRFKIGLRWYQEGNFDIARKFWKPLAQHGDCDAEYSMGLLYYKGVGVRRSYRDAVKLWTEAARRGQRQAQIALGAVYSHTGIAYTSINCKRGCGVEKDLDLAYMWFGLASKLGTAREARVAEGSIKRISAQMSTEQIDEAKREIDNWEPSPSECKSRGIYIATQ